jgi:2-oxoglutarate dehydrogenase E2 component (dihydrolipoamide succinyltransferase)
VTFPPRIEVRAPSEQSEGTRAQLLRWLKSVGERVQENEPLVELETDKVTVEIPAPTTGIVCEILKREQEAIDPGEVLARIEVEAAVSEGPRDSVTEWRAATSAHHAPVFESSTDTVGAARRGSEPLAGSHAAKLPSPAVRRLMEKHQLSLEAVQATGVGGTVTVDDVLVAVGNQTGRVGAGTLGTAPPAAGASRRIPHTLTRRRIAEHMVRSLLQTSPHVTTVFEADFSALLRHRARHQEEAQRRGASLTLTAYVLAACVHAIHAVPETNARWHEDALELIDHIDIGVGTAVLGKGLVVPVLRGVQTLGLFEIASGLAGLVQAAREDRLSPQQVRGGTFTISNHGVSGSLLAAPIVIHQPQVAILGVGKLEKRSVVIEEAGQDRIVVQPRCFLTLTIDHRAMDGDRANEFMRVLVQRLESWPEG